MIVGNKTIKTTMKTDKYLAKTISNTGMGRVNNNDKLPCFFSSENVRMDNAGIKTNNKTGANEKKEDKDTYPLSGML